MSFRLKYEKIQHNQDKKVKGKKKRICSTGKSYYKMSQTDSKPALIRLIQPHFCRFLFKTSIYFQWVLSTFHFSPKTFHFYLQTHSRDITSRQVRLPPAHFNYTFLYVPVIYVSFIEIFCTWDFPPLPFLNGPTTFRPDSPSLRPVGSWCLHRRPTSGEVSGERSQRQRSAAAAAAVPVDGRVRGQRLCHSTRQLLPALNSGWAIHRK